MVSAAVYLTLVFRQMAEHGGRVWTLEPAWLSPNSSSISPGAGHLPCLEVSFLTSAKWWWFTVMTINCVDQSGPWCPEVWSNNILGVSVGMFFFDEVCISVGGFGIKQVIFQHVGGPHLISWRPQRQISPKQEGGASRQLLVWTESDWQNYPLRL